jgi:hypothetical protein
MFRSILIANRGDNRSVAEVAAQAHVGEADVMPKPHRGASEASGDRAAQHHVQ